MLEALLELVFQFIVEFLFQIVVELGFESLAEFIRRRPKLNTAFGYIGKVLSYSFISLVGGFVGLVLSNMIPERILPRPAVPGISLFLSPLLAGLVMKRFGDWQRDKGRQPTVLASFWGGALFAFSMSLVRWLRVGKFF